MTCLAFSLLHYCSLYVRNGRLLLTISLRRKEGRICDGGLTSNVSGRVLGIGDAETSSNEGLVYFDTFRYGWHPFPTQQQQNYY
jgi:hypothetical protein